MIVVPAIDDERRASLGRLSAMLVVASLAVLPLTQRPSEIVYAAREGSEVRLGLPVPPHDASRAAVVPRRDPFVSAYVPGAPSRSGLGPSGNDAIALPPNAGALASAANAQVVVRAVVLGRYSRALVEVDGSVEVVGVGDTIGTTRVASIDAAGITLASGARVLLRREHP
ncbi:MAG: hypothetical protein KGN02_09510 [bacterium]|nr:hypothetical protein [bacterium]